MRSFSSLGNYFLLLHWLICYWLFIILFSVLFPSACLLPFSSFSWIFIRLWRYCIDPSTSLKFYFVFAIRFLLWSLFHVSTMDFFSLTSSSSTDYYVFNLSNHSSHGQHLAIFLQCSFSTVIILILWRYIYIYIYIFNFFR